MSFWDHLDELRGTILRSLLAVFLFSLLGFVFKDLLFRVVLAPAGSGFCVYRLLGWDFSMRLVNIGISTQFFVHLKAALSAGLVLAFPFVIWELWRFVSPALYERELSAARSAFLLCGGLFYLGVCIGYFAVLPVCLQFFINYSVAPGIVNTIALDSYMSMFTSLVLLIGIVFEFPAVIALLSRIGLAPKSALHKGRKYAVPAVMALSAVITPSDPFSMFVLAIPLYGLYELSILLARPETAEE